MTDSIPTLVVPTASYRRRRVGETRSRGVSVKMTPTAYEDIRVAAEAQQLGVAAYIAEAGLAMARTGTLLVSADDHPARALVMDMDPVLRKIADIRDVCRAHADDIEKDGEAVAIECRSPALERIARETVVMIDRLVERHAA